MKAKTDNLTITTTSGDPGFRIACDPDHAIDAMRYGYNDICQTQKASEEKKNVTYISSMFENCRKLQTIPAFDKSLEIIKVIFNDPATIVFWSDGDKTIVKCCDDDIFDPEKGLAMAISKKFIGSTRLLDKLVQTYYKKDEQEYFVDADSLNTIASTFAKLGSYIGGKK